MLWVQTELMQDCRGAVLEVGRFSSAYCNPNMATTQDVRYGWQEPE
jgi:hypothetical protein